MSVIKNYKSAASIVFKVLYPFGVTRWLLWFSVLGTVLAQVLVPLMGWDWLKALVFASILVNIFVSLVLVPFQIIALATSRSISLLGNSRRWLLLIMVLMISLFSLAGYWSINSLPQPPFSISLLVLWLMVSVIFQSSVWICSRWPEMHWFIFAANMTFGHIALWLSERHSVGLLIGLIASWGMFAYWWLHWQPVKYQAGHLILSYAEMQKRQAEGWLSSRIISGRAHTWYGSRLLGFSDGWSVLTKQASMLTILIFILISLFLINMEREKLIPLIQMMCCLGFAVAASLGIASSCYCNLRSIWLYTPGNRANLFSLAWSCYLRQSGSWVLFGLTLAITLELTLGTWRGAETWLVFLLSVATLQILIFYLGWFIYQTWAVSIQWFFFIGMFVYLPWAYSICATGLFFQLPFGWQEISTLWVWVPELLAIAVLHKKVRAGFSNMDLLRVL